MSAAETYAQIVRFDHPECNGWHVHFRYDSWLYFDVYPVQDWTGPNNTSGVSYIDLENEPDSREEFEEGKCLMKLQGSYCWRGLWEGRLYFPDREYWSDELAELSELFTKCIEPWCKAFIKKQEPQWTYDE